MLARLRADHAHGTEFARLEADVVAAARIHGGDYTALEDPPDDHPAWTC